MLVGKTGAMRPAIIWTAMIMSSTPATIETPGATAITAHISMMAPTLVQGAHQPGQSKMFGRRLVI